MQQTDPPPANHIIAGDQRLSQSLLWDIQRRYFLETGIAAWQNDVVPHDISSNPVMARAYSQVVMGYLLDCYAAGALDLSEPVYIVELGSGSGRLAHHFLHQFFPRLRQSPLADLQVTLVMTDFVPQLLDFWQAHGRFQPHFDAGRLDVALFDAQDPRPLHLQRTKRLLTPDHVHNPIVLLANYFFDSIPQDSFTVEDGLLCENLLTLYSSQPEPDPTDPTLWDRLELAYEAIPLAQPYYTIDAYNQILAEYEHMLPDTSLSFPSVGLDCLRFWQEAAHGRGLLLSSDRGHTLLDSLLEQDDPLPNLHGSFSLMVNYHAILRFVELIDGLPLAAPHYQDNLQVVGGVFGPRPNHAYATRQAFEDAIIHHGPDDFFGLKLALESGSEALTLPQLLAFVRLSAYDPAVLADCFDALFKQVQQESAAWYADVYAVVAQVWAQYLPLGEARNLAADIGQLFVWMGCVDEALPVLKEALAHPNADPTMLDGLLTLAPDHAGLAALLAERETA